MQTVAKLFLFSCFTLLIQTIQAQTLNGDISNGDIFRQQIEAAMNNGTYPGEPCGVRNEKNSLARSMMCTTLSNGYGTNGWQPTSGDGCNRDAACDVPAVPNVGCNGGKYRIPIAVHIFECSSWTGDNYNNNTSIGGPNNATGFITLSDLDLNLTLAELNSYYSNANIEFYEVQRNRIANCDLYDYYDTDPVSGVNDGIDDYNQTAGFDLTNVINLYFVGGLDGDHDCCGVYGFASYPTSRDYAVMRYPAGLGGTTLAHELGHYFGLFHTHHDAPSNFADVDGYPAGALDNSDCLTTGDGICDTWPDPRFDHNCDHTGATYDGCYTSGCNFDAAAFATHAHGASTTLTIDPGDGVDCTAQAGVSTVLEQNIMSYNSLSGCRSDFSYCQYRKIYDVATDNGCRAYLCRSDAGQYFATTQPGAANSTVLEICTGDAIPSFNAGKSYTDFDGVTYTVDCFDWFLNEGDLKANALATNTSTFTAPAANIDVNTPGVYTFWIAEVNNINNPPCKSEITIIVRPDPGDADAVVTINSPTTREACYTTDAAALPAGKVVGWWVTDTNPITNTVTDIGTLSFGIATATMGGPLSNPANHIYESTGGTPTNEHCLNIDCSNFPENTNIYATPFVACSSPEEPAADCSADAAGTPVSVGGNIGSRAGLVDLTTAACPTDHSGAQTWKVKLTIDAYSGGSGTLNMNMRGNGDCGNSGFLFSGGLTAPATGSVYNYTTADFPAGYDPTQPGQEICILVWDPASTTGTLNITLEVTRCYALVPPIPFPTTDYYSCVFGVPHVILCQTSLPLEIVSFSAKLQNEEVLLEWTTEVELDNEYFMIEKSRDGENFEVVGKVAGAGTTNLKQTYELIDPNPTAGLNYYRLSQTDFDGTTTYAGLETITVERKKFIEVVPNPITNNQLAFNYTTETSGYLSIEIFDVSGKLIIAQNFEVEKGNNNNTIELDNLIGGIYFIVAKQNEQVMMDRFTSF